MTTANPLHDTAADDLGELLVAAPAASKPPSSSSLVGPAAGNWAVQHNFQCIAVSLIFLQQQYPLGPEDTEAAVSAASSAVFVGCIFGQLSMGYVGDIVGRSRAMFLTLSVAAFAGLGAAVTPWGSPLAVWSTVVAWRFVQGVGLGGVYPLSATKAAEETAEGGHRATRASMAFAWQIPGSMAPYVLAMALYGALKSSDPSLQWRAQFLFGALPSLVVVWATYGAGDSAEFEAAKRSREEGSGGGSGSGGGGGGGNAAVWKALRLRKTWVQLAGTGGTWMLYDITYYGVVLIGPGIVQDVFGNGEDVVAVCWQQLVALSMQIPAVALSVHLLRPLGMKNVQLAGFYLAVACFVLMAVLYVPLRDSGRYGTLYAVYCLLCFSQTFGPNVTTFVLPSETFPVEIRATMNGVAAALAKAGAVLGSATFPVIRDLYGLPTVLLLSAGLSVAGALLTHACVDKRVGEPPEEEDGEGGLPTTR